MKQTTVFEGWYNLDTGWEFDMPVYMVNPIFGYVECGSSPAGIDELVEEYLISRFMDQDANGKAIGTDDEFLCQLEDEAKHFVKIQFSYAKKNKARKGVYYWRRVVEWDDEDEGCQNVIEEVEIGK